MKQKRTTRPKGAPRKRRSVLVIMALVMIVSVLTEVGISADPADASVCSDFPYSGQDGMRDSACRENTIDPGQYNILTRAQLTDGRANQLLNDQGFKDDWIWYAPQTTRTFYRGDGQEWSFCNTYDTTTPAVPDYFTTGGFVCDNGYPLGTSGDVMYSFASNLNSVTLDVLEFDNAFVSLTCGNFGTKNPRDPVVHIYGDKFWDGNGNGTWETGPEEARSGITFRLTRETSLFNDRSVGDSWTTTTDNAGRFDFNMADKGPGRYRIEEVLPSGWIATNGSVRYVDVLPGTGDAQYDTGDFGNAPKPPSVTVEDHTLNEGETILMDGTIVTNPAGFALTYSWSPDDKLNDGTLLQPSFTGLDDAVDDITLTVSDPFGQSGSDVSRVTTLNLPPIPEIGDNAVLDENDTFTRTGLTYTDAGVLDTHTGTVDYGDGSGPQPLALTPTGPGTGTFDLSHQYLDDDPTGTPQDEYTITVTITDDDGGVGQDTMVVTVNNLDPIPEIGEDLVLDENDTFTRTGLTYTDAGVLDTHTGTVDYGEGAGPQPLALTPTGPGTGTFDLSHQYLDDDPSGTPQDPYTITVTITDDDGGVGQDTMVVTVNNLDPAVEAGDSEVIDEGDLFERELPFGDIGTLDTHTVTVDFDEGDGFEPVSIIPGTRSFLLSHLYADDDPTATPQDDYTIRVRVEDDDLGVVEDSFILTVNDVAPDLEITNPSFDGELFAAPATIDLVAPFTDPGTRDTFECRIDWDEGPATLDPPEPDTVFAAPFSGTTGNCDATNVFEQAGVYTIRVTVTDDDTLYDVEERMIVVYDPSAGFVTGGGYIDSPAGAYLPDPTLTGKATFGFVSKYKKNGATPEGNTEFQFHAGDLNFHSVDYDWLVVTANGTRAQYKGNGTINGSGDYGFMMTVFDNGEPGSGVDQLRMKIWDRTTDALVYDNRVGLSDDVDRADPQIITNGNIAIHTKGRNN